MNLSVDLGGMMTSRRSLTSSIARIYNMYIFTQLMPVEFVACENSSYYTYK